MAVNLDPSMLKSNYFYFKVAQVENDDGWLFPNSNLQTSYMFDRNSLDIEFRTNSAEPLLRWMIFSSKENVI